MRTKASAVSIIVPTLREAANIATLAERIERSVSPTDVEWELIIADDDSNDGSKAIVAALAEKLPVRMVTRSETPPDLSRSVLLGLDIARFERIVVMDADLSHPPEQIPALLAALERGWPMAIGSRHAPGGSIERGWGAWRSANSGLGAWLARAADTVLGPNVRVLRRRARGDPQSARPPGVQDRARNHGARRARRERSADRLSGSAPGREQDGVARTRPVPAPDRAALPLEAPEHQARRLLRRGGRMRVRGQRRVLDRARGARARSPHRTRAVVLPRSDDHVGGGLRQIWSRWLSSPIRRICGPPGLTPSMQSSA